MTSRAVPVVALAALFSAACSRGCGEDLPDPDVCSGARAGRIDTVEVGRVEDGRDGEVFTPYAGGDVIRFIYNDSGDATLPLHFRFTGADIPTCVEHRTELLGCPAGEACADGLTQHLLMIAPLHTYPRDGGGAETKTLFLPLDRDNEPADGARLELVTTIGGLDASVQLWLEEAGPDAAPPAAADAAP